MSNISITRRFFTSAGASLTFLNIAFWPRIRMLMIGAVRNMSISPRPASMAWRVATPVALTWTSMSFSRLLTMLAKVVITR
ncbi:MAG: hypothetical protein QF582_21945 [Alphaproteobacteria bacterium]|nr:hypothetical protein [Alphaproteobacteria bacterium]